MVEPVPQSWYKLDTLSRMEVGYGLQHPEPGTASFSFLMSVQRWVWSLPISAAVLPGGSPPLFSHLSGHDKKYKCFEVSPCVTHKGHLRHVINCPHGANIQEEINSFKGAWSLGSTHCALISGEQLDFLNAFWTHHLWQISVFLQAICPSVTEPTSSPK